ncbi:uncharacterized protein LOC122534400 [Frieseomelitta varia]|uniref:uncharacterized protein LOC122534400 n=1 Tax=Frieseomelitta varia TaxID=561572 RepID=UPI001CB67ABA|nr:uncharacterized protein LOC122534400 [Frieseomelitta varia]
MINSCDSASDTVLLSVKSTIAGQLCLSLVHCKPHCIPEHDFSYLLFTLLNLWPHQLNLLIVYISVRAPFICTYNVMSCDHITVKYYLFHGAEFIPSYTIA